MESEIIKSKLAYRSHGYKTAASEHRYHSHLTISNFGREFVVAIIDRLSGQRRLYLWGGSTTRRGIDSSRDNIPVKNVYHCRVVNIYEVINDELKMVGIHSPYDVTPDHVRENDYTEIEDDNYYENIYSVEIDEGGEGYVFNVVVVCKPGNKRELSIKQRLDLN